jgi:hypothetical protein
MTSNSVYYYGRILSMDSDGFPWSRTKNGGTSGIAQISHVAFR